MRLTRPGGRAGGVPAAMLAREASCAKLLLVDGHAYAYRSFHAIRSLTSPQGQPTNAIFGFIKSLTKLRGDICPTHLAVIWDGGLAAERLVLLPEYKAQRPPMPAALEKQINEIHLWLEASGVPSLRHAGIEADDWIATLACQTAAAGNEVIIASSDKDFMQLVSSRIRLLNPNDKTGSLWGAEAVRARAGVAPDQIVDWLSLVGDAVDNIPGVSGVGAKTAAMLLQQFGSWERLQERCDEVRPEKLRLALASAGEIVARNRQMIRLKGDLPVECRLEGLETRAEQPDRLREMYHGWGFRTLFESLETNVSRQGILF